MNSAAPTTAPLRFSMSPNALMAPRPQSVLTARKSARLTPSLSTYCSRPSASISEGGLMRKIHGLPRLVIEAALEVSTTIGTPYSATVPEWGSLTLILIEAFDCAGLGVVAISARMCVFRSFQRLVIGRLLRVGEGWQGEYPSPPVAQARRFADAGFASIFFVGT